MSYAVRRFLTKCAIILWFAIGGAAGEIVKAVDLPTAGTNASGYSYYATALPFVDVARMGASWQSIDAQGFPLDGSTINVNGDGYPTALAPGQMARSLIFTHNGEVYPTGQYTLTWQGNGEVRLYGPGMTVVGSNPGQITYRVDATNPNGLLLDVMTTDPTNPVRNISVKAPFPSAGGTFNDKYMSDLARYGVIRYMGWNSVNNSDISSWSDRTTPSDFFWGKLAGVPYELQIQLSNELEQDLWLTVPHLADDTYVQNLATLVKQQLSPDLRVWVEYSNEVWNGGYDQFHHAENVLRPQYGVANSAQAYGRRSAEIFDIFSAQINDPKRVVRVIAGQTANSQVLEQSLLGATVGGELKADVAAVAPYFTVDIDRLYEKHLNGSVKLDEVFQELRSNIDVVTGWVNNNKAVADAHGLPLVSYEGGQHLVARPGEQHNDQGFVNLLIQLNRDERMGDLYKYMLDSWYAAGGKTFVFAGETAVAGKWGTWGLKENYLDDNAVKFRAVQEYLENVQRQVGDFNGDDRVNLDDYFYWINGLGDGHYGVDDYFVMVNNFGRSEVFSTSGFRLSIVTVPEPQLPLLVAWAVSFAMLNVRSLRTPG